MNESYEKKLTANDVGRTGSHQAGICVPKRNRELLSFFPPLDASQLNPDAQIECIDPRGFRWPMHYIYYNGKLSGRSTRNEYRITCMTGFFKQWNAAEGDVIVFSATEAKHEFKVELKKPETRGQAIDFSDVIVLRGWRKVH